MKKVINDAHAPNPIGSYNQGIVSNGFVFISGQIPIDPDTGKIVEGDFKTRIRQVFKNIAAILDRRLKFITSCKIYSIYYRYVTLC